jgi:hypothetical protein
MRRGLPDPAFDLGTAVAPTDGARHQKSADAVLRGGVSLDRCLSVLQSRRAADRGNRAAPFFHVVPVFGAIMAIAFLGERPQTFHIIGFALLLSGVFVASRQPKPR